MHFPVSGSQEVPGSVPALKQRHNLKYTVHRQRWQPASWRVRFPNFDTNHKLTCTQLPSDHNIHSNTDHIWLLQHQACTYTARPHRTDCSKNLPETSRNQNYAVRSKQFDEMENTWPHKGAASPCVNEAHFSHQVKRPKQRNELKMFLYQKTLLRNRS